MDNFLKIGITMPGYVENEVRKIEKLLDSGFDYVHIRKPEATKEELLRFIKKISERYRKYVVLHDHHDLTETLILGGVHLNSRNPEIPKDLPYSVSCHSLEEIKQWKGAHYIFLSPIYDSISKPGYKSRFNINEVSEKIRGKNIVALGGVTSDKIPELKEAAFIGAAFMGDLWQNLEKYIQ